MSQETVAAKDMIARLAQWQGHDPESVAADATYGKGEFLRFLMERGITRICVAHSGQCFAEEQSALWPLTEASVVAGCGHKPIPDRGTNLDRPKLSEDQNTNRSKQISL